MTVEIRQINLADEVASCVIAALEPCLDNHDQQLAALAPRLDNQDRQLAAIGKVLNEDTATSKEVASIDDSIASLQRDLTTVKSEVRGIGGQFCRLQSRLDRVEIPAESSGPVASHLPLDRAAASDAGRQHRPDDVHPPLAGDGAPQAGIGFSV